MIIMPEGREKQPVNNPSGKKRGAKQQSSQNGEIPRQPVESGKPLKSTSTPAVEGKKGTNAPPVQKVVGGHESTKNNQRRRHKNNSGEGGSVANNSFPPSGIHADELIRRAWEIYLGEVTEEGLALMDTPSAEAAANDAFRIAEIFLTRAAAYRKNDSTPT